MVERWGDRHLKGRVGGGCSWEGTLYPRALWRVHSQHSGFLFPVGERSAGNTRYVCFVLFECFPLLKKPVRVKQRALFSWLISPLGRGKRECKPCLDRWSSTTRILRREEALYRWFDKQNKLGERNDKMHVFAIIKRVFNRTMIK